MKHISKRLLFLVLVCTFVGSFFLFAEYRRLSDENLHFVMYDIPLGDALIFKTPHGKIVAVDGGIDDTFFQKLSAELPFWNKEIEMLIISHPDTDHFVGSMEILKKYPVHAVLLTGVNSLSLQFAEFMKIVEAKEIPVILTNSSSDFQIDGVTFDVLSPEISFLGDFSTEINNTSSLLRVSYGESSLVLTGDMGKEREEEILRNIPFSLRSDILKVAHHGSKSSSLPAFLEAVRGRFALISASKNNKFHHPHEEIMARLKDFSYISLVTRDTGDIHIISSGEDFWISEKESSL